MLTRAARLKELIELCGLSTDHDLWFLGVKAGKFDESVSHPEFEYIKAEALLRDLYSHMYSTVEREVVEIRGEDLTNLRVVEFDDDAEIKKYGWPTVSVYHRVIMMIVARTGVKVVSPVLSGARIITPIDSIPKVSLLVRPGVVANENAA